MGFSNPKKIRFVLVLSLMLCGCASYGPTEDANYEQLINTALPPDAGAVKMSAPGEWWRDTDGWKINFNNPYYPTSGSVVITETALYFLQWYKKTSSYKIMLRIKYDEIESLELAKQGFGRRVAIQRKDSSFVSSFNSFDFRNKKAEEAFRLLQEMRKTAAPSTTP